MTSVGCHFETMPTVTLNISEKFSFIEAFKILHFVQNEGVEWHPERSEGSYTSMENCCNGQSQIAPTAIESNDIYFNAISCSYKAYIITIP